MTTYIHGRESHDSNMQYFALHPFGLSISCPSHTYQMPATAIHTKHTDQIHGQLHEMLRKCTTPSVNPPWSTTRVISNKVCYGRKGCGNKHLASHAVFAAPRKVHLGPRAIALDLSGPENMCTPVRLCRVRCPVP